MGTEKPQKRFKLLARVTGSAKRRCVESQQPSTSTDPLKPPRPVSAQVLASPYRHALKIRIATHNAHDSVPLGDLADWLGELPDSNNASYPLDDDGIPHLPLDDQHPYHLVVVGSQESPSSGTKLADALWDYLAAGRGKKPASPTVGSPQEVTTNATGFEASGLYEHLATSRLSGIVISVFVLKSAAKAIAGLDKAKVVTGIGNVVGNKGGAAVSVQIASLRLLFMSAHLAAHQTEIAHRERDFARISRELAINDFKPGSTAANIPSRFDCAFLLGDLNFRLDLSRLHCDWLMQNKDYRSAMAFDQLRPLTSNSASAFHGWSEGEITFAPTYKYDVVKLERRRSLRHVVERGRTRTSSTADPGKLKCSPSTTAKSRNSLPPPTESSQVSLTLSSNGTTPLASHQTSFASETSPLKHAASTEMSRRSSQEDSGPTMATKYSTIVPEAIQRVRTRVLAKLATELAEVSSTPPKRSSVENMAACSESGEKEATPVVATKTPEAVFDSSKKQRVQSWTDRILWKSTMTVNETAEGVRVVIEAPAETAFKPRLERLKRIISPSRSSDTPTSPTSANEEQGPYQRNSMQRCVTLPSRYQAHADRYHSEAGDILGTLRGPPKPEGDSPPTLRITLPDSPPRRPRSHSISNGDAGLASSDKVGYGLSLFRTLTLRPYRTGESAYEERRPSSATTTFRTWWSSHMPAFLSAMGDDETRDISAHEAEVPLPAPPKIGPRPGEVQCLKYDSVSDLAKMEISSDHRPLFGVYAIGLE